MCVWVDMLLRRRPRQPAGTHDVVLGLVALDVVRDLDREDVVAPDRRRQMVPIYR